MNKMMNIALALSAAGMLLTGCQQASETAMPTEVIIENENITVSFYDNDEHYGYCALADVEEFYYNDKLESVSINNPTLLSFAIPDKYTDGMVIMSGEQLEQIKAFLNDGDVDSAMEILNTLFALMDCPT